MVAPRADRFQMALPVRYRSLPERTWHEGQIENISGSGVLFRTAVPLAAATAVEMMFFLPAIAPQPSASVRCRAEVVRTAPPEPPDTRPAVAVAIRRYRLTSGARAQRTPQPSAPAESAS